MESEVTVPTWILFAIGIAAVVVFGIGTVIYGLLRNVRAARGTVQEKYPQGHWMGLGMCIGIAFGCIPSLAGLFVDDLSSFLAVGPAIGCGLGVAIGAALERKHKDELRPLTLAEQQTRFRLTLLSLGSLALLVLLLFLLGGTLCLSR
jgi:hypothetical protein